MTSPAMEDQGTRQLMQRRRKSIRWQLLQRRPVIRWSSTAAAVLAFMLLEIPAAVAQTVVPPTSENRNPASIAAEINRIDAPREPLAPFPGLDPLFKPWYDFKSNLQENYGFGFGIAWTPLYQVATDSLPGRDNDAAGGIFEILGLWTLIDRNGEHPGSIGFRVENRHRLGTPFPPQSLGAAIGAGTPTALGFSEFDLSVAELYYQQAIIKDRFLVRVGKMTPFAVYDFFFFKNPKTDFMNANFALNPSIAWPQFGLGAATHVRPREDLYLTVGIHDANGTPTQAGFDTFFDEREYFVACDLGWDPGYLEGDKTNPMAPNYHITGWHSDARVQAGRPEGWGIGFTAQQPFGKFVPFIRYGYSDGGAAPLKHLVMLGVGWIDAFLYEKDALGFAVSFGKPYAAGMRDQYTAELYYRTQLTRRLAITPSVQLIGNPSNNPDQDLLALFGIRARLDF